MEPPCVTVAKEEKVVKSAGKGMVTMFWHNERLLRVDFLYYGININGEYYASLLKWLCERNIEKKHGKMPK